MLAKVKIFLWFWNVFKGNSLNSRFRKHLLGVMEPPQIKNERYFSHVFQLFVGAKPNSCFLGRKNFDKQKRFTRKLGFSWKWGLFDEKGLQASRNGGTIFSNFLGNSLLLNKHGFFPLHQPFQFCWNSSRRCACLVKSVLVCWKRMLVWIIL